MLPLSAWKTEGPRVVPFSFPRNRQRSGSFRGRQTGRKRSGGQDTTGPKRSGHPDPERRKNGRHLQNREILRTFGGVFGEMQEWLNWPAWKASKPLKGFRGSNPLLSAACENRVASDLAARFLLRFRVSRRGFSGRGAPSLSRARRRAVPRRLRSASTRRSACGHAGGRTRAGWRRAVSARSGCTAAA